MTEKTIVLTVTSGGIGVALTDYLLGHDERRLALQYRSAPDELLDTLCVATASIPIATAFAPTSRARTTREPFARPCSSGSGLRGA